jgi:outer membrane murein-binding lipoprotein Lpp
MKKVLLSSLVIAGLALTGCSGAKKEENKTEVNVTAPVAEANKTEANATAPVAEANKTEANATK